MYNAVQGTGQCPLYRASEKGTIDGFLTKEL